MSAPPAPKGLRAAGRALWDELQETWNFDAAETTMLLQMCRTVDEMERLYHIAEMQGAMNGKRVHPALVEARQQRITFMRLHAALRLPDADDGLKRPQRRAGTRGSYKVV